MPTKISSSNETKKQKSNSTVPLATVSDANPSLVVSSKKKLKQSRISFGPPSANKIKHEQHHDDKQNDTSNKKMIDEVKSDDEVVPLESKSELALTSSAAIKTEIILKDIGNYKDTSVPTKKEVYGRKNRKRNHATVENDDEENNNDDTDDEEEDTDEECLPAVSKGRYKIGTKVRQHFGRQYGWFDGKIVAYSQNERYYQIRFSDGDEQELSHYEKKLEEIIENYDRHYSTIKSTVSPTRPSTSLRKEQQQMTPSPTKSSNVTLSDSSTMAEAKPARVCVSKRTKKEETVKNEEIKQEIMSTNIRGTPVRSSFRRAAKIVKKLVIDDDDSEEMNDTNDGNEEDNTSHSSNASDDDELENLELDDDDDDNFESKKQRKLVSGTATKSNTIHIDNDNRIDNKTIQKRSVLAVLKPQQMPKKELKPKSQNQTQIKKKIKGSTVPGTLKTPTIPGSYDKKPYSAGVDLPIIVEPQEMFDDMIYKQLTNSGADLKILLPIVQNHTRTIKVATMCSGTESPILALDMLQKSIQEFVTDHAETYKNTYNIDVRNPDCKILRLQHVFSCEIEPFKQAYIERNFSPPLLFRDIRELGCDEAYTAYGALERVPNQPGDVDILIAGTSCVDYSNLNTKKKDLEDHGESGQTFVGMLKWIHKAQPTIVIIENVYGAPWDKKVQMFEDLGYAATFSRIDTKDYYIPHTRQRGYLFAIKKDTKLSCGVGKKKQTKDSVDSCMPKWQEMLTKLKRKASATLDDFMLANDDPRVLRGRVRLTAESMTSGNDKESGGSRAGRVDWTKCETRHQDSRSKEMLGDKRPLTGWTESGNTTMPSFAWNEWTNAQVHRIHDLMDINTLRLAKSGIDCTYKTMVWNLSQNVDRDTMGKLGLCQCLTPTGVPYVTNRGGPLVGEELLLLQGIPADDLLLTKESEDNLKDLAGNAMSTTVVGACTLAAILLGFESGSLCRTEFKKNEQSKKGVDHTSLVPRALVPVSKVEVTTAGYNYEESEIELAPLKKLEGKNDWESFLEDGFSSSRKCVSEGAEEVIDNDLLVICKECGHSSTRENAFPPRKYEEHVFEEFSNSVVRIQPSAFRKRMMDLLPMRLQVFGLQFDKIPPPESKNKSTIWDQWIQLAKETVLTDGNEPKEFRFTRILRTTFWTAYFVSDAGARIEGRLSKSEFTWYLFAKPYTKDGPLKSALERPLARMKVTHLSSNQHTLLYDGQWEVCIPHCTELKVGVEGVGKLVPSWKNLLGLKGTFEKEYEYEVLRITLQGADLAMELKNRVEGDYKFLPTCGGPCGSLRKKDGRNGDDVFFFLSSGRKSHQSEDSFVFAPTCHRASNSEYREVFLEIDKSLQYRPQHYVNDNSELSEPTKKEMVQAIIPGQWTKVLESGIRPFSADNGCRMLLSRPNSSLSVSGDTGGWEAVSELVHGIVPVRPTERLSVLCEKARGPLEVNLQKARKVFDEISYATSRFSMPTSLCNGEWNPLHQSTPKMIDTDNACHICAPVKPSVRWTSVTKGGRSMFIPIEDAKEAAIYEKRLKNRPHPWIVRLSTERMSKSDPWTSLHVSVSCNANSLLHRALGLLPSHTLPRNAFLDRIESDRFVEVGSTSMEWRVVQHVEKATPSFAKLTFTSNKNDLKSAQPPNFVKYPLRKEQLRSLAWMLRQEATTVAFHEEEFTESVLPCLNWRAEGRVRRPVLVRGGIIADEVGYGKTAITLGLIDSSEAVNGPTPDPPKWYQDRFVSTKATLVIVPKHLMGQWPQEIKKFLGSKRTVEVIQDMSTLNSMTVERIQAADIVVVSFAVLSNDKYFSRLARFAGVNPKSLPSGGVGGRHFNAVYKECIAGIPSRVSQLDLNPSAVYKLITDDAESHKEQQKVATDDLRLDSKKHYYSKTGTKATAVSTSSSKIEPAERDPWGLSTSKVKNSYAKMTCPPLELFFWNRLVVDEFTYLTKKDRDRVWEFILKIKSTYRWCLSGTPKHSDFNDIQTLAGLLDVHLGVNEVLPGVKLNKRMLSEKENTGLESLSHYLESRSMQWHERRHVLSQQFLDRFVRQNIAEIDEIPYEEHTVEIELPAVERAIYLELETHLKSLEMDSKNAKRSKKRSTGDRENRMQEALQESGSAEEALLKCCSHFNLSSSTATALETLVDLINIREEQKNKLEQVLRQSLAAAFRQRHKILQYQPDWLSVKETGQGEVRDGLGEYLALVSAKGGVPHGGDQEVNEHLDEIVQSAMDDYKTNPTKVDSTFAVGDSDDDDDNDESAGNGKKRKRSPKKGTSTSSKSKAIDADTFFSMKHALRNHMHDVRSLVKELCGRTRSLRYIQQITDLQKLSSNTGNEIVCENCKANGLSIHDVGVLSCCGHYGCLKCLRSAAEEGKCIQFGCEARVSTAHIVSADNLGLDRYTLGTCSGKFGAKLAGIVKKVKEIITEDKNSGLTDRVIVFCQFDDLKKKVKDALETSNIKSLEVKGTVQQQIQTVGIFQKDTPDKLDPRVLLLKMDDEQSAGLNLTNLNHALFVHPLLASSQSDYDAYETQAIGRIRRFGQSKTVHVWRFLANNTIDTEIYNERHKK